MRPEQRPQSIAQLRTLLDLPSALLRQRPAAVAPPEASRPETVARQSGPQRAGNAAPADAGNARKRYATVAAVLVVLMLVLVAGAASVYWITRERTPAVVAKVPSATLAPTAPPPVPPFTPAPAPSMTPSMATTTALDPIDVLDHIFQASNREHAVTVTVHQPQVVNGKDHLQFAVRSSKPGYVYLLMVGTERSQFWLLFPNELDRNNHIGADSTLELPRPSWRMTATGPSGVDHLLAMVSDAPRDFSPAGLTANPPFAEFPPVALAQPAPDTNGLPVFAGTARCAGSAPCSKSYGAALFSIEETAAP